MLKSIEEEKKYLHFLRTLVACERDKIPAHLQEKLEELIALNRSYDEKILGIENDVKVREQEMSALEAKREDISKAQINVNETVFSVEKKRKELNAFNAELQILEADLEYEVDNAKDKAKILAQQIENNRVKGNELDFRTNKVTERLQENDALHDELKQKDHKQSEKIRILSDKIMEQNNLISEVDKTKTSIDEVQAFYQERLRKFGDREEKLLERENTVHSLDEGIKNDRKHLTKQWLRLREVTRRRKLEHILGDENDEKDT